MKIRLNENELIMAGVVGVRRQAQSLSRNAKDAYGADPEKGWKIAIEGACGELAFAKAMNWHWDGSVGTYKKPDVNGVYVRTRLRDDFQLLIRPYEKGIFAVVRGLAPNYEILGWFAAKNVKKEWIKTYGGRPPAYFVPDEELYPIETLVDELKK